MVDALTWPQVVGTGMAKLVVTEEGGTRVVDSEADGVDSKLDCVVDSEVADDSKGEEEDSREEEEEEGLQSWG